MREGERDLGSFLGEEGKEEDRGAKRAGCSPWKKVALVGTVGTVASALTGTEADKEGKEDKEDKEGRVVVKGS